MPPEMVMPGSPADWLRHAYSDLALASIVPFPPVLPEQLCFHAQQAAEKALKALLIAYRLSVPRTHNLRTLLELLPAEVLVPSDVQQAVGLSDYAVTSRYPGVSEPIGPEEQHEALELAEAVIYWAEQVIMRRSLDASAPSGQ